MYYFVYILICADKSYYTGITNNLDKRVMEHDCRLIKGCYTPSRLPVRLVWFESFDNPSDAIKTEKQIKGWSRKKKEGFD